MASRWFWHGSYHCPICRKEVGFDNLLYHLFNEHKLAELLQKFNKEGS
jgi:hypothetical protein